MTKNLNYLVAGEKMGPSKREKAAELGVPVISLADFLAMVGSGTIEKIDYRKIFGDGSRKSCILGEVDTFGTVCRKKVVDINVDPAADAALLKEHKLELAESVAEFYSQIKAIDLRWETDEDHPPVLKPLDGDSRVYISGQINVRSLQEMIEGPDGNGWEDILWFDDGEPRYATYWKQFLVFDQSIAECFTLLRKNKGKIEDRIYFFYGDPDEKPKDMNMGVQEYLDLAYRVKGSAGWQYILMDRDEPHWNEKTQHYLPQLFPNIKFDFKGFPKVKK